MPYILGIIGLVLAWWGYADRQATAKADRQAAFYDCMDDTKSDKPHWTIAKIEDVCEYHLYK